LHLVGSIDLWATKALKKQDELGHQESFRLAPGKFVLAETLEVITVPRDMIARVEGRSTYARMGLSMHQTAPWLQPGWTGKIILEIMNNGKITIELTPEIDHPCQITFFQLTSELAKELAYGGKPGDVYQEQLHPFKPGG
jgi:dCTP deaminase